MKIIDRGFIRISPTQKFIDWAKSVSEETPFFDNTPEASIYLIEDDFWEDEKVLEKYFKKIAKQEFAAFEAEKESQPECTDLEMFQNYFDVELGTFVYDLIGNSIQSEKV